MCTCNFNGNQLLITCCNFIYIYIYRERERERERVKKPRTPTLRDLCFKLKPHNTCEIQNQVRCAYENMGRFTKENILQRKSQLLQYFAKLHIFLLCSFNGFALCHVSLFILVGDRSYVFAIDLVPLTLLWSRTRGKASKYLCLLAPFQFFGTSNCESTIGLGCLAQIQKIPFLSQLGNTLGCRGFGFPVEPWG